MPLDRKRTINGPVAKGEGGEESSGILFQQMFLSRGGEGGGEGERDLFKATLLLQLSLSVCQGLQLPHTGGTGLGSSW
jgi:hypothetical protein